MPALKKPKLKPVQTPASGSSPVTPPGGSVKKPTVGRRAAPALVAPPAQPLTAVARQLMQRHLAALPPAPPLVRPPGLAVPAQPAPATPPQMQTRPAPPAINAGLPQWARDVQAAQRNPPTYGPSVNYDPTPGPTYNPRGFFGPEGRLAQARDAIMQPATVETSPTGLATTDLLIGGNHSWAGTANPMLNAANQPQVLGTRQNDDGSEDWVVAGPNGKPVYQPHIRQVSPSPLQVVARGLGQAVQMGLEALGLPAKGVEMILGNVTMQAGGAQITGNVNLPDGSVYAPPNYDPARARQAATYQGGRNFVPGATNTAPLTAGGQSITSPAGASNAYERVGDVAKRLFGDTPEVAQALGEVNRIAYSPGTSQLRAVARIVEYGQPPDLALYGDAGYVNDHLVALGYLDDPVKAIQADPLANYVYQAWKADGYSDEKIVQIFNTQGLPGEQYLPSEMVGQVLLDPLNFVGELTRPAQEAARAADATAQFLTRTGRSVEEIADGLRRGLTPTRVGLLDALIGRTPTAVKSEMVTTAGDALSFLLTAAREAGGKADELNKVKAPAYQVMVALAEWGRAAPTRELFESDEAYRLGLAAWRAGQDSAAHLLSTYPVALSDAGKLAGGLLRKLLQNEDGTLNGQKLLKFIADEKGAGKPAHEIMTALADQLDQAAESLLLPERAGARDVTKFVEQTGQPAQTFPIFERGLAGAQERVQVERAARAAGLEYNAGTPAHLLDGFASFRNSVNKALWRVFAEVSPAFSARNALNNLVTASADGNMSFERMDVIEAFNREVLGSPLAAFQGLGTAGAETGKATTGGFAGNMRTGDLPLVGKLFQAANVDIPLGAAAVERSFSQRIVYAAAKRYLDRMMVLGKAIPDLPPSVLEALGDETARGLVQHIAASYGDVDGALAWLEKRGQNVELWRIPTSEHAAALTEFDGAVQQRVTEALETAQTPAELQASLAAIRRDVQAQLKVADEAMPSLTAMSDQVAESYASDVKAAAGAGVRIPGAAPEDFEARLKADRQQVDTARGVAERALRQGGGTPERYENFLDVQAQVTRQGQATAEAVDKLRAATLKRQEAIRSMKLSGDAKGHMLDDLWRKYFTERDAAWRGYRRHAVELWNGVSRGLGVEMTSVPEAEQMAMYARQAEQEVRRELLGSQANVDFEAARQISATSTQPAVAYDFRDKRWGIDGKNVNRWNIDLSTGTVEPPKLWVNETGNYQYAPPKGRPTLGQQPRPVLPSVADTITAPNGEVWRRLPANEIDGWVEKYGEAAGYDIGDPNFSWQVVEQDLLDHLRNQAGLERRATGRTTTAAFDAATMPAGVSNVTPVTGGPEVAVNTQGVPNFDIPGPQAIPEGGAGTPLQLRMQGSLGPGPQAGAIPTGNIAAPELIGTPMQIPARWNPADPRSILSTLGSIERDALERWGQTRPLGLDEATWQLARDWAEATRRQTQEARVIAGQVGTEARNFALLNYSDRYNFDTALGVTYPYHYWYGRTQANWLKRAVLNPAMLANYGRYRTALERIHAALPDYWQQQLSTDDLGIDLDTPLMFNLEQTLSPLYGLLGSDFSDPNRRRAAGGLGALAEDASALGPTVWTPIAWALATAAYLSGDQAAADATLNNYLGAPSRALRAATAWAGETAWGQGLGLPPGGVNLDPQMLIANMANGGGVNVQGMTQWERNRVAQVLTGYLDNPPAGVDPADWQAQLSEAAYLQRGPLWDKAMQAMFADTAPAVLTSYFVGLGFKGRQETEAEFSDIYREVASLRSNYPNMTPEQVQQAYLDLERRHPMYDLLMLSRAQGPQRDDAWVWEAVNRVGIGDRGAWEAAGVSEDALDAFFNTKTTEGMNADLYKELMAGVNTINARNRPRSLEEAQRQLDAQQAYNAIKTGLAAQFPPEVFDLEQEYFDVRDASGPEAANAWLDNLPAGEQGQLFGLWDARAEAQLAAGPDVQRYFLDPERYEQLLVSRHYDDLEAQYPGIRDLSNTYRDLRNSDDYDAASLLKEEHPELQEYWDANDAFFGGELRQQVQAWLKTLPATTRGEARADFDPQGLAQDNLTQYYRDQATALQGGYPSAYGNETADQPKGSATLADQYRAQAEALRTEADGRQTYLTPKAQLAYTDANIQALVDQFGAAGAAAYLEQPIAPDWPEVSGTAGVRALLAMVGDADSIRAGLLAYATENQNANWVRYVGLLRNMDDAALDRLTRQYPQLADAALVAEQARTYDQPTMQALHDILGFSISFREDGSFSVTRQTVKKDKKTGGYGPTTQGGAGGASSSAGFSGGATSRGAYERMSGRGGGGGGGGGGGAPDPQAESLGGWISFAAQLKLEQPDLLNYLMSFFDAPDDYARQALLARYPQLAAYLQSLGADKLAALADGYYAWREDQQAQQQAASPSHKASGPQIVRYYQQRPSTTGLT